MRYVSGSNGAVLHCHWGRSNKFMSRYLLTSIHIGVVLVLWMPFVVTYGTIFPFIVGKVVYARIIIEVITAAWVVLVLLEPNYRPRRSWVLFAFGLYVWTALVSAVAGVSFTHSMWSDYARMVGVWDLLHWFLFALVTVSVLRSTGVWRSLLNWNLAVALVLSLLALGQAYNAPGFVFHARAYATLGNPSYLAAILTTTTLVAVGFLASSLATAASPSTGQHGPRATGQHGPRATGQHRSRGTASHRWNAMGGQVLLWRVFWAATATLGIWALYVTGTRGALAGLVAGAVAMPVALIIFGNRKALKPVTMAALGVLSGVMVLLIMDINPNFSILPRVPGQTTSDRIMNTSIEETSVAVRLKLIEVAVRGFIDRPIMGWGQSNFDPVYDRFADASFYKYGTIPADLPHNKVAEELVTKGIVGTITYGGLWAVLVWGIVRRRREPSKEVLAYAVLGALAGYFVQNLFLFDTPAMLLEWTLLLTWVVMEEQATREETREPSPDTQKAKTPSRRPRSLTGRAMINPRLRYALILATVAMLGMSLYSLNYRPFVAAGLFDQASNVSGTLEDDLTLAQRSFDTLPAMATLLRRFMLKRLNTEWDDMTPAQRVLALEFVYDQSREGLEADPYNARLISNLLPVLQAVATSEERQQQLEPLLRRLQEYAPEQVYTYEALAVQEIQKGNYREALRIIDEFETIAPWAPDLLTSARRAAEEGLSKKGT